MHDLIQAIGIVSGVLTIGEVVLRTTKAFGDGTVTVIIRPKRKTAKKRSRASRKADEGDIYHSHLAGCTA